jgi:DNA-binding transcriptional regulator LsrR (DeoR family)
MNPATAQMIRKLYFSRQMKQRELGKKFQLTQGNVSKIISGAIWNV